MRSYETDDVIHDRVAKPRPLALQNSITISFHYIFKVDFPYHHGNHRGSRILPMPLPPKKIADQRKLRLKSKG